MNSMRSRAKPTILQTSQHCERPRANIRMPSSSRPISRTPINAKPPRHTRAGLNFRLAPISDLLPFRKVPDMTDKQNLNAGFTGTPAEQPEGLTKVAKSAAKEMKREAYAVALVPESTRIPQAHCCSPPALSHSGLAISLVDRRRKVRHAHIGDSGSRVTSTRRMHRFFD